MSHDVLSASYNKRNGFMFMCFKTQWNTSSKCFDLISIIKINKIIQHKYINLNMYHYNTWFPIKIVYEETKIKSLFKVQT